MDGHYMRNGENNNQQDKLSSVSKCKLIIPLMNIHSHKRNNTTQSKHKKQRQLPSRIHIFGHDDIATLT